MRYPWYTGTRRYRADRYRAGTKSMDAKSKHGATWQGDPRSILLVNYY